MADLPPPQDLWKIGSRIISNAKRINSLTYDCMQEMAIFGAQVLDMRAAMLAAKWKVPLLVAHAHKNSSGTQVFDTDKINTDMEEHRTIPVNIKNDLAKKCFNMISDIKKVFRIGQTFKLNGFVCYCPSM